MEHYVLDTSALIALRSDEEGAGRVEEILRKAEARRVSVSVSFITVLEIFYCTWRVGGKEAAHRAFLELKMLPIHRVDVNDALLFLAGELKAEFPLSLADSLIAACAMDRQATLVHKDPEFEALKDRVLLQALPYK